MIATLMERTMRDLKLRPPPLDPALKNLRIR
jgi:hypothetical protein